MGFLVAIGFELVIGAILGFVLFLFSLFFGHIDIFESIAVGIICGCIAHGMFDMHIALALVIGIITFIAMVFLIRTSVGFWVIGGVMSVAWGFIGAFIAYTVKGESVLWVYASWAVCAVIMMGLHLYARKNITA